jgi:PKD repeat protein
VPGGNFSGEETNFSVPAGNVTLTLTVSSQGDGTLAGSATQSVSVPNRAPALSLAVASTSVPTGTAVELSISATDEDGWVEAYFADFGDGNSSNALADMLGYRYAQPGTFTIKVRAVDNLGGYDERSVTVTVVNRAPTARVDPPYWYGEVADEVVLNGSASTDPEGGALLFEWQFGDGRNATGPRAVHHYATPGVYEAVLTVTDDHGAAHSTTVRVQLFAPRGDEAPGSLLTAIFLAFVVVVTVGYLASRRRHGAEPLPPPAPPEREKPN